eukprot:GFKZ01000344.1.p1 GENE.GFKZ01000344.1~~GFKZ01000344.1.p1  ORF type:complete len:482 (+),score=55.77 GFKZ01000344.1:151-1596(+)
MSFLLAHPIIIYSAATSTNGEPPEPPTWFFRIYWVLIVVILILGTITQTGQFHASSQTSTFLSVITLIVIDSVAYVTIALSASLLIFAAIISKPWNEITATFVAPLAALITSVIFGLSMQVDERRILTLWLRCATLLSVDTMDIDVQSLSAALQNYRAVNTSILTEPDVFALMRTNRPGGVAAAARNKGSARPFLTAFSVWRRSGNPPAESRVFVIKRVRGSNRPALLTRQISSYRVLKALEASGRTHRRHSDAVSASPETVTIVSAFDGCVRWMPCKSFGRMWLRASKQPRLDKKSEGWWFIGADIVDSLKSCFGLSFLTEDGRFDDIKELWGWVEDLGYGWRKEFQLRLVAEEIARVAWDDELIVTNKALFLAGEGSDVQTTDKQRRLAVEANAVSCLGLAVRVAVLELQYRLDELCKGFVSILRDAGEEHEGLWIMRGPWPEAQISQLLFEWVGIAAVAMGRAGGPGLRAQGDRRIFG